MPQAKMVVSAHTCILCHRVFPTGSALGGHVRWQRLCKIIERKGKLREDILNFNKKKSSCGVCNKRFRSGNSLLRHMESHSESDVRNKPGDPSTHFKYLPSSSRVKPSTRTALDYLQELLSCSSPTAGLGVEETEIALEGKHKRINKGSHNSVRKTGETGMAEETPTLRIEEPKSRSLGRVLFVRDLDLNKLPSPELRPVEWSNHDGTADPSD